jgi:hypothetical protein
MENYRLDQRVDPEHHPAAVKRMTEPKRRSYRPVGGELPGRKIDGRRQAAFFPLGRIEIASSGARFCIVSASSAEPPSRRWQGRVDVDLA